jgi:pimeloyl-ACP methyl ester carboxylesterase
MNPGVMSRLPSIQSLKKPALILFGVLATLLLFLWLALPRIIQWQAEKFIAEKSGHHLTLDRPEFNPFEWRLYLHKLQLSEPDGKPLLAFDDLLVDISAASLTQRAFVFDATG